MEGFHRLPESKEIEMNIFHNDRTCFPRVLIMVCIFVIPSCKDSGCDGRVNERHQDPETVPSNVRRYSDEEILQHDLAISHWFTKQYSSMSVISSNEKNEIRLRSYMESSTTASKMKILDLQRRAINEFLASYQGSDKESILEKWLATQAEAAEVLRKFLREVQMLPKNVSNYEKQFTEYEILLDKQKRYLDAFRIYRQQWKSDFQGDQTRESNRSR